MGVSSGHLDGTLERSFTRRMERHVSDYELIKKGEHPKFRFVNEFLLSIGYTRQNFNKLYNRYVAAGRDPGLLLPQKRGRKFTGVMLNKDIQDEVVRLRESGFGRHDIYSVMLPKYGGITPSPSTIYNILKANNLNRYIEENPAAKKRYVKEKIGEMLHIDCHYLSPGIVDSKAVKPKKYYLVGVIDDHSRVAWCEVVDNIKSITVSMSTMKILSVLNQSFNITGKEILSDNGAEFGSGQQAKNSETNPFKLMMKELDIKQRYIRPGRPQTNGKIERFWKTIETELLAEQTYKNLDELNLNILNYLIYYNKVRPHQGIKNYTPYKQMIKNYQKQNQQQIT